MGHRLRHSTELLLHVVGLSKVCGGLLSTGMCNHCMNSSSELLYGSDSASLKLIEESIVFQKRFVTSWSIVLSS
jgi:hypothetical protein